MDRHKRKCNQCRFAKETWRLACKGRLCVKCTTNAPFRLQYTLEGSYWWQNFAIKLCFLYERLLEGPYRSRHSFHYRNSSTSMCIQLRHTLINLYLKASYIPDAVFTEALIHLNFLQEKCSNFVVTKDISSSLDRIMNFFKEPSRSPFVLYGISGSGKTSLLAYLVNSIWYTIFWHLFIHSCEKVAEIAQSSTKIIIRFVGTTAESTSARALLHSICQQIIQIYKFKDDIHEFLFVLFTLNYLTTSSGGFGFVKSCLFYFAPYGTAISAFVPFYRFIGST